MDAPTCFPPFPVAAFWPNFPCGRPILCGSPMTWRALMNHVDIYHADVADGHFSPAMLLFPDLIAQIRPLTEKPMHVHLMVADTALMDQIDQFAEAGADIISMHAENADAGRLSTISAARGMAAGIVLQLHTPVHPSNPIWTGWRC